MAAVPVEIRGTLYDLVSRTTRQVLLVGDASRSDLGIGGGPVIPPGQPGGGGPVDPGWGYPERPVDPGYGYPSRPVDPGYSVPENGGRPSHPIVLPGDPSWGDPRPAHPIVLPPPNLPVDPPAGGTKPPPEGAAGWGYYDSRWGYFPAPTDAQPK